MSNTLISEKGLRENSKKLYKDLSRMVKYIMDTVGRIVIDTQVYYSADDIKTKVRACAGGARNARKNGA